MSGGQNEQRRRTVELLDQRGGAGELVQERPVRGLPPRRHRAQEPLHVGDAREPPGQSQESLPLAGARHAHVT